MLEVEEESFTNPWTREMYAWELQNRASATSSSSARTEQRVAGFCAFWLVVDEIHINNVAIRPRSRGRASARADAARVRRGEAAGRAAGHARSSASNEAARRLYERLGFYVAGTRPNYYTNPVEDALILWRDEP